MKAKGKRTYKEVKKDNSPINKLILLALIVTLGLLAYHQGYGLTPLRVIKGAEAFYYFESKGVLAQAKTSDNNILILTRGDKWHSLGYIQKKAFLWKYLDGVLGAEIPPGDTLAIRDIKISLGGRGLYSGMLWLYIRPHHCHHNRPKW